MTVTVAPHPEGLIAFALAGNNVRQRWTTAIYPLPHHQRSAMSYCSFMRFGFPHKNFTSSFSHDSFIRNLYCRIQLNLISLVIIQKLFDS